MIIMYLALLNNQIQSTVLWSELGGKKNTGGQQSSEGGGADQLG